MGGGGWWEGIIKDRVGLFFLNTATYLLTVYSPPLGSVHKNITTPLNLDLHKTHFKASISLINLNIIKHCLNPGRFYPP